MDPLFERRNLKKLVHIHSKFLQKNIQASLLAQLKMNYEGTCIPEGFIEQNSITILNYSVGRANYIKGGVDYSGEFQADICMPHAGQKFRAPVKLRSKIGIHAETPPIKVLIPRDLHLGNEDFENIKVDDDSATLFRPVKKGDGKHRFLIMSPEQASRVREAIVQLSVEPPAAKK
jgi:DNA-directed RNA polymerase subunit E'/Rpb7